MQFPVHRTIIALTQADDKGSDLTRLLHGQSENVITTVLHYLYCESLPVGLSEETAKACINAVKSAACLRDFLQLCDSFLQNTALKQRMYNFVLKQCIYNTALKKCICNSALKQRICNTALK